MQRQERDELPGRLLDAGAVRWGSIPRLPADRTGPLALPLVVGMDNIFDGGPEGSSEYTWRVLLKAEGAREAVTEDPQQADREERQRQLSEELDRLQEMHRASEGNKILSRNQSLATSYHVFLGNHRELKGFLDHIAAPTVNAHMWAERHRYRLDYAFDEVARLLHNYVSAVFSLVEATRKFARKHYADTDLIKDYENRVKDDFDEAPLHRFLQDLRNYTLHYRLPATRAVSGFKRREDGGTDSYNSFKLNVEKLRKWNSWKARAREYIKDLGSEADLADIIEAYEPVVTDFHGWFSDRINAEHAEALNELFDLETRMKKVEREWRISWGDREVVGREAPPESNRVPLGEVYSEEAGSDFATIDDLISTLYASVSFPHGGLPNLDRFRSLFLRDALVLHVESNDTYLSNIGEYIRDFHVALNEGKKTAVTETEVARRAFPLGDVAHVLSFHEEHYIEDGERKSKQGLYDLHLVKAGDRWAITSVHLCHGYGVKLVRSSGQPTDQSATQR